MESFKCLNCGKDVKEGGFIGTKNRNHCPYCLWSLHLDQEISGDRKALCKRKMEPIGLTFKKEGVDKYGKEKEGEIMIIHKCTKCGKVSINRIAGDDHEKEIFNLFKKTININKELKEKLEEKDIIPLREEDKEELTRQLLGVTA